MSWSNENFPGCDRFDGPDSRITGRLPRGDDDEPGLERFNPQGVREEAPEEDEDGPYGHCDTCGAPCDRDGCMSDRSHVIANG